MICNAILDIEDITFDKRSVTFSLKGSDSIYNLLINRVTDEVFYVFLLERQSIVMNGITHSIEVDYSNSITAISIAKLIYRNYKEFRDNCIAYPLYYINLSESNFRKKELKENGERFYYPVGKFKTKQDYIDCFLAKKREIHTRFLKDMFYKLEDYDRDLLVELIKQDSL